MGIVKLGVPEQILLELATLNKSEIFIETGTFQGGTTRWAAKHFGNVHTIEKSKKLFERYSGDLNKIKGIQTHFGDSREVLPQIIDEISDESAVFWLDGHWSGGETAGENDECPLTGELAALKSRRRDIILIDDARLFLSAPPLPHDPSQWVNLQEIFRLLPENSFVQIIDDVIFSIPDEKNMRDCLTAYAQNRSNDFWQEFGRLQHGKTSVSTRFKSFLKRNLRS